MRQLAFRIVRNGVVAAFPLALIGYLLAELAGFGLATQPGFAQPRDAVAVEEVSAQLRQRLPFTMAAWGVGLVTAFELLLYLVRGNPAPLSPEVTESSESKSIPHDDLYNKLLQHAEAPGQTTADATVTPAAAPTPSRSTDAPA